MYRSCSRCGKIHNVKHNCKLGLVKRKYKPSDSEEHKLRNTTAWVYKSKEMKQRAGYLCEVCKAEGVYNYNDLETHHIKKLKYDHTKLLDDDNLIVLCISHHKLADAGMLSESYLTELAKARNKKEFC